MITLHNISKHFGGVHAVNDVSLTIEKGNITGLVGPNGAGKSVLFNLMAGLYPPTSGTIFLDGENITHLRSDERFHKGMLRTFQVAHEFPTLSVLENLMVVPSQQTGEILIHTWLQRLRIKQEERTLQYKAYEVLEFLNISHLAYEPAGTLSGGQKKLLELGRTMMVDAKIVLLDEVGAGVNKTLLSAIADAILVLNKERGYTFCIIEHDMDFIDKLCNPLIVFAQGSILTTGKPSEVKQDEKVIASYLGESLSLKKLV